MEDLARLKHLIEHWTEHNEGHLKTYIEWEEKTRALGRPELTEIMHRIVEKTGRMQELFRQAGEEAAKEE